MTDRCEMEDAYTLKHENGSRWSTGVSLADCTIPFVELLNPTVEEMVKAEEEDY